MNEELLKCGKGYLYVNPTFADNFKDVKNYIIHMYLSEDKKIFLTDINRESNATLDDIIDIFNKYMCDGIIVDCRGLGNQIAIELETRCKNVIKIRPTRKTNSVGNLFIDKYNEKLSKYLLECVGYLNTLDKEIENSCYIKIKEPSVQTTEEESEYVYGRMTCDLKYLFNEIIKE